MKKRPQYDIFLFALLATLAFLPMLQQHLGLFRTKPLNGVTEEKEMPQWTLEAFRDGTFSREAEACLGTHFGFREPIVRLYNQYLWDAYGKTYAHDVVRGKDGWLFYPQNVDDYYGTELLKWQPSVETARKNYDLEVKYLNWTRTILKENGVDLMVFLAPEKGFLYPEHLPSRDRDTTGFNARAYFEEKFVETGFPCIEMTRWFQQMKDTANYPLIPQTGGHWNFSSVYAADSLLRYMETLKGVRLPRISINEWHEVSKYDYEADTDLEQLLNLMRPICKRSALAPEAKVHIETDAKCIKPKVLFIGNSYFWRIAHYVPLHEIFEEVEFWYYYSTAYFGEGFEQTRKVGEMDLLERLLDFDYVIWFTTGNQLYKGIQGFAKDAVVELCVDDSILMPYARHIADSLQFDSLMMKRFDTLPAQDAYASLIWDAHKIIKAHPEMIHELRADSLSIRNSEIPYARYTKDIRKDTAWMAALEAQGFLRTATLPMMLRAEADHIMQGKALYREQEVEIQFSLRCQKEVKELIERMRDHPETMDIVREKAEKHEKTLEKALEDDATWLIRQKYHLDRCRLADDPDAIIPVPK